MALAFDKGRAQRLMMLPPLFDEANKFRRQATEIMRRLDDRGIDCFLPDLPGWNESTAPFDQQSLIGWQTATNAAAVHFRATHVFAVRASCTLAPDETPALLYAAQLPARQLRSLIRARMIASREAGAPETSDEIAIKGHSGGVTLAGWPISPAMFADLENMNMPENAIFTALSHDEIGGSPFWLWAEPGFNAEQADALASAIANWMHTA